MPKRTDIKSICIIGAGPIIIGQACEFDYSGTQACKALREEGYRVILVNSNPATIMTDPEMADATYIEPITPAIVAKILEKERPDALLPTMGGQTALNTALALSENGTLKRLGIELIGANEEAIAKAEDRDLFKKEMDKLGLESAKSMLAHNREEADLALETIGLPAIIRPAFTMGGTGGGIAYNKDQFLQITTEGIDASPINQILVEESLLGWKEYEMEVVRDKNDNCIIVCSIENVDPMGVHTGDSITVAPALTLTDKEYQIMRNASLAVLRGIGVETGGSNVQFAVNPADGRLIVIEMNPRVSRSSALASKATGFPIAKVAAKLAVGYTLDELGNDITGGKTPASFEPTIDYVVTKMPRFNFEKFKGSEKRLTTSMKSVGEAMSFGRSFEESFQKALRSMEEGLTGFDEIKIGDTKKGVAPHIDQIRAAISVPTPRRILYVAQAMRFGMSLKDIHAACKIDMWFLQRIENIINKEAEIRESGLPKTPQKWLEIKKMGFSDARLAKIVGSDEESVKLARLKHNIHPVYKRVDSCAAEIPSETPYMYSCYEGNGMNPAESECEPTDKKKVIILGGGPNRIGQGIEFDYCCVHACYALQEAGYETIMVNCNPETVSTDYDTADRLYFEPLTAEDVLEIIRAESENGEVYGVIVQLGGQTPLKLANYLKDNGVRILGTDPDAIDLAEDRERFQKLLKKLKLRQPKNGLAHSKQEALDMAEDIGFPLVIRPSYVLGGQGMEIVQNMEELERYMGRAMNVSGKNPVLLDKYLKGAIEMDVDAICDGKEVYVAGIMEHIEEAGVHSGDSASVLPPHSIPFKTVKELERQTIMLAKALKVKGLMNVQFALKRNKQTGEYDVFIIEVNPRASRTVPFVAKATNVPVAKIAARVMAGEKLSDFKDLLIGMSAEHTAVKAPVFPFDRFPGTDTILGPEMKSTGEVMGIDKDVAQAFAKSQLAARVVLPTSGKVFLSVKDSDKESLIPLAKDLKDMGFTLVATGGTCASLQEAGLEVTRINKVMEGHPHIVDAIINEDIDFMINTTKGPQAVADSFSIRRQALAHKIPYYTLMTSARAGVQAIRSMKNRDMDVTPIQDYFPAIAEINEDTEAA
ncbi:MAG: carbamoyl-phosphate synthase large subunit [Alphaproteobacteria bacterium]|nr:carbamoyl-phosphate synthase large subunit [Alphaproteobacteria bacterium]NCQ87713.1 carbamoyl-phosphate synthase large subunit [Alphaproteobacteria bacterium]NCT05778.1 carbamoyl-phosphate synthase large subunit [Alphaproteobacteria bacterium]